MPAAAVIPIVLGVTGASAAIGATVATAIGIGTVSAVAATAIGWRCAEISSAGRCHKLCRWHHSRQPW